MIVLTVVAGGVMAQQGVESHPWIGEMAPAFELAGIEGDTLSLAKLKGKLVVIHFGASW
jgi:hypothetical protein